MRGEGTFGKVKFGNLEKIPKSGAKLSSGACIIFAPRELADLDLELIHKMKAIYSKINAL